MEIHGKYMFIFHYSQFNQLHPHPIVLHGVLRVPETKPAKYFSICVNQPSSFDNMVVF
jgi:hypothetical protein